jgi:hypothetical protein
MATLAQRKGSVNDIQAPLRHSKGDTTAKGYMQELPESVGRMVESMYEELTHNQVARLRFATNEDGSPAAICMKEMVGTRRLQNVVLSRNRVNTLIRLWLLLSVEDAALDGPAGRNDHG